MSRSGTSRSTDARVVLAIRYCRMLLTKGEGAMKRAMVVVALLVALALAVSVAGLAAQKGGGKAKPAKKSMLAGSKWQVDLTPPGKGAKAMPDTLTFEKGMFDSSACHAYGFGNGAYKAKKAKAGMDFTAATKSAKEGKMSWSGKTEGSKISGTMMWQKKKGRAQKFTFSGRKA